MVIKISILTVRLFRKSNGLRNIHFGCGSANFRIRKDASKIRGKIALHA